LKPSLLFVSDSTPFPPKDGKRQRTLALLHALSKGYQVDLLILGIHHEFSLAEKALIKEVNCFFISLHKQSGFLKKLGLSFRPIKTNQIEINDFLRGKGYDKIFCRYASSARDFPKSDNLAIDIDDDYLEFMETKISMEKNWFHKIRLRQILTLNKKYYFEILGKANYLFLSKDQKLSFNYFILSNLPFQAILHGKKIKFNQPNSQDLLFVGKLSYEPKSQGIRWFLNFVWPELKRRKPSIGLSIVSVNEPNESLKKLIKESNGVRLLINVDDLSDVYNQHRLTIVPIFRGSGSNIKLAESLYYYRNVVASTFGAKGFEQFIPSGLVTVADSCQEWIEAIENSLARELSEQDFSKVEQDFSFESWSGKLIRILNGK
jgi:polysaccharide biosynthesis protein PslH